MAAAAALTLLAALVPGRLGQLLRFGFQQFAQSSFRTASDKFLVLPLDYFLIQLYSLPRHGLLSLFRMVCRNFILPEICKPCLFLCLFQFAQFILLYRIFYLQGTEASWPDGQNQQATAAIWFSQQFVLKREADAL